MSEKKFDFVNKNIGLKTFQTGSFSDYIPMSQYIPITKNISSYPKKIKQADISETPTFSIYEGDYIPKELMRKKSFLTDAKNNIFKFFRFFIH